MYNAQFAMYNYFELLFVVLIIEIKSLINSLQSSCKLLNDFPSIIFEALNRFNQYSDSLASFNYMFNLLIKSFVDGAFCASVIFAPIEVPDLKICFKTGSKEGSCFNKNL